MVCGTDYVTRHQLVEVLANVIWYSALIGFVLFWK